MAMMQGGFVSLLPVGCRRLADERLDNPSIHAAQRFSVRGLTTRGRVITRKIYCEQALYYRRSLTSRS